MLPFIVSLLLAIQVSSQPEYSKLRPSPDFWDRKQRHVPVKLLRVSEDRNLATVGDTLYMLDGRGRIVWTWTSHGPPFTDLPVIDSKGTIYVIGFDLLWAAFDSATGKQRWRGTANGRAVYTQIKLYKNDMYLVVTDMEGYRQNLSDRDLADYLTLCKGNAILWEINIPAGSRIEVRGGKVFGLIRRKRHIVRTEIMIPRSLGKPIGKVSTLADYE